MIFLCLLVVGGKSSNIIRQIKLCATGFEKTQLLCTVTKFN